MRFYACEYCDSGIDFWNEEEFLDQLLVQLESENAELVSTTLITSSSHLSEMKALRLELAEERKLRKLAENSTSEAVATVTGSSPPPPPHPPPPTGYVIWNSQEDQYKFLPKSAKTPNDKVLCRRLGLGVKTWTCSMTENTIISLGYGGESHYASVDLQVLHYKDSFVFILKMYSKSSEVYSSLLLNPSILCVVFNLMHHSSGGQFCSLELNMSPDWQRLWTF